MAYYILGYFEPLFYSLCACTNLCKGFFLPGPDKSGNLVVLDHRREDLCSCSDPQHPGAEGKDYSTPSTEGTYSCLNDYLNEVVKQ